MDRFSSVGQRILFVVGVCLLVGFGAVTWLYIDRQEKQLLAQNEADLLRITQSTVKGLQSIMMKGYGGIAHGYSEGLGKLPEVLDYRVLRTNGVEAFADAETVIKVNAALGEYEFKERRFSRPAERVMAADEPAIREVLASQRAVIFYASSNGMPTVTVLDPIPESEGCNKCHADAAKVRGFIKLTVALDQIHSDLRVTLLESIAFILTCMGLTIFVIYRFSHRTVVAPIQKVTAAMSVAAGGDLSVSLPVRRADEIGQMATSFNEMSQRLTSLYSGLRDEQNTLTTIILGSNEGIVVTDPEQRIVLVNPAACELLGASDTQIIAAGFRYLFDSPEWIDRQLAASAAIPPELINYHDRVLALQASTIRNGDGQVIGSAALIRDVTQEKRAEENLRRQANTDALTGLYNRRFFDGQLREEYMRWQRYKGAFSVALFDVDHFKKFNDTYGHDCGDRVLKALAGLLKAAADPVATVCRYGGEELVLILPDFDEEKAAQIADLLREMIADLMIDTLHVTVSIGVAGCPDTAVESGEALLKRADIALYEAKEGGRNQVRRASQSPSATPPASAS